MISFGLIVCLFLCWGLHRAQRKTNADIRKMKETVEAFAAYRDALRTLNSKRQSKEIARGVTLFEKADSTPSRRWDDSRVHLESSFSKGVCATKTTSAIAACSSPAAYSG